ncbi:hypothetical protein ABZ890_44310, partial [Streptomyces sp. NPDC046984]
KLEQERLVYQARLRSRFGRAWRRKAPVESLMPLRLAKYGVPLMNTAPAGMAATHMEPPPVPGRAPSVLSPMPRQHRQHKATGANSPQATAQPRDDGSGPTTAASAATPDQSSLRRTDEETAEEFAATHLAHARKQPEHRVPSPTLVASLQGHVTNQGSAPPTVRATTAPGAQAPNESVAAENDLGPIPAGVGTHATKGRPRPHVKATIDALSPHMPAEGSHLTLVDRYYLAWTEYRTHHGDEPTSQELSAYLADKGLHGRGGKPVSPSTLRRYFLPFRLYTVWAGHRTHSSAPALHAIAHDCAAHGITAQYNKPLTVNDINEHVDDFERRWQATTQHHTDPQQPHVDG